MAANEIALWEFGRDSQKIIEKEDLSRDASYGMFGQLITASPICTRAHFIRAGGQRRDH